MIQALTLQFFWGYHPGRVNVADPLSRHPSFSTNMVSATIITAELAQLSLSSVTDFDTVAEDDEVAAADIKMLSQIYPGYETDPWFATASHTANLDVYQGLYYKSDVMQSLCHTFLSSSARYCTSCMTPTLGSHRTMHSGHSMYWWPNMHTAMHEYVRGCKVCQQDKHLQRQPAGMLVPLPVPESSWDSVTGDCIPNLPKIQQGFTAILVVVDG